MTGTGRVTMLLASQTAHSLQAGRFARPARVGADSAVLVVPRVPLTFFAAEAARRDARIEHFADDLSVRPRATGGKRCRRTADVGAIQIDPNALTQRGHPLLGNACVSA